MSRLVHLEQGSQEWHAWRATRYTASNAPAVMAENPWFPRTPRELYLVDTGQKQVVVTAAMRAGNTDEPRIRELTAAMVGLEDDTGHPACVEAEVDGIPLGASLDCVCWRRKSAWELKRPGAGSGSDLWTATEAPRNYYWQMVHTLLVAQELEQISLVVYAHDLDQVRVVQTIRQADIADDIVKLVMAWRRYDDAVANLNPPALTDADVVDLDGDTDWQAAAAVYAAAMQAVRDAEAAAATAKDDLLVLAKARGQGAKVRGAGVQAFSSTRAGNVNWKAAPIVSALAAAGVDPEAFRGKSSTFWTVKETT